jgi:hypothetical protein
MYKGWRAITQSPNHPVNHKRCWGKCRGFQRQNFKPAQMCKLDSCETHAPHLCFFHKESTDVASLKFNSGMCLSNLFLYKAIERLSHLYPNLEVPGLTCPGREWTQASRVGIEHSRKEPSRQLFGTSTYEHATRPLLQCRREFSCSADIFERIFQTLEEWVSWKSASRRNCVKNEAKDSSLLLYWCPRIPSQVLSHCIAIHPLSPLWPGRRMTSTIENKLIN